MRSSTHSYWSDTYPRDEDFVPTWKHIRFVGNIATCLLSETTSTFKISTCLICIPFLYIWCGLLTYDGHPRARKWLEIFHGGSVLQGRLNTSSGVSSKYKHFKLRTDRRLRWCEGVQSCSPEMVVLFEKRVLCTRITLSAKKSPTNLVTTAMLSTQRILSYSMHMRDVHSMRVTLTRHQTRSNLMYLHYGSRYFH